MGIPMMTPGNCRQAMQSKADLVRPQASGGGKSKGRLKADEWRPQGASRGGLLTLL